MEKAAERQAKEEVHSRREELRIARSVAQMGMQEAFPLSHYLPLLSLRRVRVLGVSDGSTAVGVSAGTAASATATSQHAALGAVLPASATAGSGAYTVRERVFTLQLELQPSESAVGSGNLSALLHARTLSSDQRSASLQLQRAGAAAGPGGPSGAVVGGSPAPQSLTVAVPESALRALLSKVPDVWLAGPASIAGAAMSAMQRGGSGDAGSTGHQAAVSSLTKLLEGLRLAMQLEVPLQLQRALTAVGEFPTLPKQ
jgi:hypothetical protein